METALKVFEFYSRIKCVPGEIAKVAPYVPFALAKQFIDKYSTTETSNHPGQANTPLVILIHGTDGGSWQWIIVRQYLQAAGYKSTCLLYNSQNKVAHSCSKLQKDLQSLLQKEETGRNFVLIGHSQGGLLARMLYERCKKLPVPCSKVFILHAPQNGTSAARIWNTLKSCIGLSTYESFKDMEDGTEFVKYYKEHCVDPEDPNVYEAAGSLDYIQENEAFVSSLPNNRYVGCYGHYSPMVNKSLWNEFIIPNLKDQEST